ncbi:hypothetical protein AJ79_03836 [Helicocarpus griseus UAMH5409]|uniref:Uncharacterized protein n=1 Tax=Helicocarpus griseus UAMH5409 TaxID=1447875 RepID=A0A2B7XW00_9EURO|nr:hypothetical protein AJ79_03836 [Helicocarpus griseus UAMH5409]
MFRNYIRVAPACRFLVPRTPHRSFSFTKHSGVVRIQRVRFKRPWIRRGITTILTTIVATHVYFAILGPVLDRLAESNEHIRKEIKEESLQQKPNDVNHLPFLPIGLPIPIPTGSRGDGDPRWKEFVSFTNDKQRMLKIRAELISILVNHFNDPRNHFAQAVGRPLRSKLETIVPEFPIPELYKQPGIQFGPERPMWVYRTVPIEKGVWIRSVTGPWDILEAATKAGTFFFRKKFGKNPTVHLGGVQRGARDNGVADSEHSKASPGENTSNRPSDPAQSHQKYLPLGTPAGNIPKPAHSTEQFQPSKSSATLQKQSGQPGDSNQTVSDFKEAMTMFMTLLAMQRRMANHRSRPEMYTFRGTLALSGPRGVCELDVVGVYDISQKKWAGISTNVRNLYLNKDGVEYVRRSSGAGN